jgi:transcriptional regulator with XRE-family HTH domain
MKSLKLLREELGLSQTVLGKILGIKRGNLAAIEAGRLKLQEPARSIVHWIEENLDLFHTPEPKPEIPTDRIRIDLRKLRNEKDKLILDLERRQEKETNLVRTRLLCEGLLKNFPNPTKQMQLHLDSLGYDAGLALEKLQATPALRIRARIKGIEAEIEALENGIAEGRLVQSS